MNTPLIITSAILMIVSGFTLGSQMTAALMNPGHISFYAPIVVLGGVVVNAASFPAFIKGFKALSL